MYKYALIGRNISYSLSPFIHNKLYKLYDIDAKYDLLDVDSLDEIDFYKYNGFNVTTPYKKEISNKLNISLSELNIYNTLYFKGEQIEATNTDILAFASFCNNHLDKDVKVVGILGNSATSEMIKYYFKESEVEVVVFSRTADISNNIFSYEDLAKFDVDFLINTTPYGQGEYRGKSILTIEQLLKLENLKYVLDFNYNPYNTKLLLISKSLGIKAYNGLEILVKQAIYSFEIWFNIKVPDEVISDIIFELSCSYTKGILVYGMPLSGKTYSYSKLDKKILAYDLDYEIEKSLETTIQDYVDKFSIEKFRDYEYKILNSVLSLDYDKFKYIFLGGGTLTNPIAFDLLEDYLLVYKKEDLKTLILRLDDSEKNKRPLLRNENSLEKLYDQRIYLYENIQDYLYEDFIDKIKKKL